MYLSGLNGTSYGVSQAACRAMGGQWQNANPNVPTFNPVGNCFTPDAPRVVQQAAAPVITVTVPTNVNTQVNPQISPNLIQQQQPQNSPVNATTQQEQAPQVVTPTPVIVAPTPIVDTSLLPTTDNRNDDIMALLDAMKANQPASLPAPAAQVQYVPTDSGSSVPAQVTNIGDNFSKYLPFAVIAAGLAIYMMNDKKRGAKHVS